MYLNMMYLNTIPALQTHGQWRHLNITTFLEGWGQPMVLLFNCQHVINYDDYWGYVNQVCNRLYLYLQQYLELLINKNSI